MNEQPRNGGELIDPRLARLYHEAAHEEPPADLDAAILAVARREGGARPHGVASETSGDVSSEAASVSAPGPGVGPARFLRAWRLPVSLAAVVVLAVSVVAVMVEQDGAQKAELMPTNPPQPMADGTRTPKLRAPAAPAPGAHSEKALQDRRSAMEPETANRRDDTLERADTAHGAAPAANSSEEKAAMARRRAFSAPSVPQSATQQDPEASAPVPLASTLAAEYADEPPGKWGEKIVDLRRQGRSAEADELLAEFRRRFPDHVVPEAWRR